MAFSQRRLLVKAIAVGTGVLVLALAWWLSAHTAPAETIVDGSKPVADVGHPNQADGKKTPVDPSGTTTAGATAWRQVNTSGSASLVHVSPDGSGFLLWDEHAPTGPAMLYVKTADLSAEELPLRRTRMTIGGQIINVQVADTPFGPMLAPGTPGALSPDGRYLAVSRGGIWVADLESGEVRRLGLEPEPPPPNQVKHQGWEWAGRPRWSADGKWIYFSSHRLHPEQPSLWRVPAIGGEEELISRQATDLAEGVDLAGDGTTLFIDPLSGTAPARADRIEVRDGKIWLHPADGSAPRVAAENLSPALPPGVMLDQMNMWHGDRVLLLTQTAPNVEPLFLSVLDVTLGNLAHYTPPAPTRGRIRPLGWIDENRILARILPLSGRDNADPTAAPAPAGTWILDLTAYAPPPPAVPNRLLSAQMSGHFSWKQSASNGPVIGGEVSALPGSVITLRYDQSLEATWIHNEVEVTGPALVETLGGPLGLALVRLDRAQVGDRVRIQSPSSEFDLRIQVEGLPVAELDISNSDGDWEPVLPDKTWPVGPLDLRIRLSHPVDREEFLRGFMSDKQPRLPAGAQVEWIDDTLRIHLPDPPTVVWISLDGLTDARGWKFTERRLPPVYLGPAPRLVAVQQGEDRAIAPVPHEVLSAQFTDGTLHVTAYADAGDYVLRERRHLLDINLLQWRDGPDFLPDPLALGLRMADRHGESVAGIESVGRLGPDGGYLYEGDLVVRGAGGKEIRPVRGLRSFWPFGSDNLGRSAGALAWNPGGTRLALSLPTDSQGYVLSLVDPDSTEVRELANGLKGGAIHWSLHGRHIAVGTQLLALDSGAVVTELPASWHLRWSPDGNQVLYNLNDWGEVQVLELATGRVTSLGKGLPVGWDSQGLPLVIRWEGSADRYIYRGI